MSIPRSVSVFACAAVALGAAGASAQEEPTSPAPLGPRKSLEAMAIPAREFIAIASTLGEQELAEQGAALMARRAHDRWLLSQGKLLAHYGVAEPGGD